MQLKKIVFTLLAILLFIPIAAVAASDTKPILILDARNAPQLPRNFRMATTIFPDMRIAGGAQFSEMGLVKMLERLRAKRIVIIDLREESHGFLNGNAISWYGPQDAANANKTASQINNEQMQLLLGLLSKKSVVINKVLKKSKASGAVESVEPVEFAVHQVLSESELASKHHLVYHRLYVQDFHAPTAADVDQFIQIVRKLPKTEWIYVHCHAGVGRTTTFMTMYDMMFHAKDTSFETILNRQHAIGGKDLQAFPPESSFKYENSKERFEFLQKFYEYARTNNNHFKTSWTKWLSGDIK